MRCTRALLSGCVAALAVACSSDSGPNISGLDPIAISRVEIAPQLDTFVVRDTLRSPADTVRFSAAVVMHSGAFRTDVPLAWSSSDPTVAIVDQTGLVQIVGYGETRIKASAGKAAEALLVVVPELAADAEPNTILSNSRALLIGGETTCVLTARRRIFCTGSDAEEKLAAEADTSCFNAYQGNLGTVTCTLIPLRVDSDVRFAQLTMSRGHACALDLDGVARCWAQNGSGQFGNGSTAGSTRPTLVSALHRFNSIVGGGAHTCGIDTDGAAWCWGNDQHGQLGSDRLAAHSTTPIPVNGGRTDWVELAAGTDHTCGRTSGGAVLCWGLNDVGQLGAGATGADQLSPVQVAGGITFATITAADSTTCGLAQNGTAYCWGRGSMGQIGNGGVANAAAPVAIGGGFSAISAGGPVTCGIQNSSAVCWGTFDLGTQGPQMVGLTPTAVPGNPSYSFIAAGRRHACGVTSAGQAQCWGSNVFGSFGDGMQALWRPSPQHFMLPPQ